MSWYTECSVLSRTGWDLGSSLSESCKKMGCSSELVVNGAVSSLMFSACDDASSVQAVCDDANGCICHATGVEEGPEVTLDIQCLRPQQFPQPKRWWQCTGYKGLSRLSK